MICAALVLIDESPPSDAPLEDCWQNANRAYRHRLERAQTQIGHFAIINSILCIMS